MEVQLSSEQQERLAKLAAQRGVEASAVLSQMVAQALEYEEWFISAVEEAEAEIDRGEFVEHEEVKARVERMLAKEL